MLGCCRIIVVSEIRVGSKDRARNFADSIGRIKTSP